MVCPECKGDVKVVDTVTNDECVYRRRKCLSCGHTFYTREEYADQTDRAKFAFKKKWSSITRKIGLF